MKNFSYRKRLVIVVFLCVSIFIFPSPVEAKSPCEKVSEYRQHFETFSRKYHDHISQNWATVPDEYLSFVVSGFATITFSIAFPPKVVSEVFSPLSHFFVIQKCVEAALSIDQKKEVVNDLLKCVRDHGAKACFSPPRRLEEFKNKYPPHIIQIAVNEWDGIYRNNARAGNSDIDHRVSLVIDKVLGIKQYGACQGAFCFGTRLGGLLGLELFTAAVYSKEFEEECECFQSDL